MKKTLRNSRATRRSTRGMALGLIALAMTGSALAGTVLKEAPAAAKNSEAQVGTASWYGGKFNGRKTASGERFDMNALTCAHRSLPLGSWVRVTNMLNLKSIFVRVNDRGPVPRSRVLDLSFAAARKLGIGGLGKVKIEPIRDGDTNLFDAASRAQLLQTLKLASTFPDVQILPTLVAAR